MYSNKVPLEDKLKCILCDSSFKNGHDRNKHLKDIHDLTYEQYIMSNYFNNEYQTCQCGCGTIMTFINSPFGVWFKEYTTNHFPRKLHTEETKEKIKINTAKAINEKYGVDNIYLLKSLKDEANKKTKETKLYRYDDENYNNMEQNKLTKLERHGDENYSNVEKRMETCRRKYNSPFYFGSEIGKLTIKKVFNEKYGVDSPMKVPEFLQKIFDTKLKKYGYFSEFVDPEYRKLYNTKKSISELEVLSKLTNATGSFRYENKEFDIKTNDNNIYEIDGDYFHPSNLENINISQLCTGLNDYVKNKSVENSEYTLYRIKISELPKIINEETLQQNSYIQNHSISYFQIIVSKEMIEGYIKYKGINKLKSNRTIFFNTIKLLQPTFPIIETNENLNEIILTIQQNNLDFYDYPTNTFNDNSYIGVEYLQSIFYSYWNSSYKNQLSPKLFWENEKSIKELIYYNIGLNDSNEVFDFSLHQLIRGLSARRITISFFKPLLASCIYTQLNKENKEDLTVIDPCSGFGGRLLGFISKFPKGTYIGIEPNKETFNELMYLKDELTKVLDLRDDQIRLFNCKFEEYENCFDYDLVFTSIPYFDTEIYSDNVVYKDFETWKEVFIRRFYQYDNVYINMSNELYMRLGLNNSKIEYYIQSNTTHFNKDKNSKNEVICRIN
jgi:hypothetical protein